MNQNYDSCSVTDLRWRFPRRTWLQHPTPHIRGVINHILAVSEAWLFLLLAQLEQFQSLSSTSQVTLLKSQVSEQLCTAPRSTGQPAALFWEGSSGHGRDFTTPLRHPASLSAEGQLWKTTWTQGRKAKIPPGQSPWFYFQGSASGSHEKPHMHIKSLANTWPNN